jgi:hypothetical protein
MATTISSITGNARGTSSSGGNYNRSSRGKETRHIEGFDPELEQRLKSLQRPAACSFIFSMAERYIRSSREISSRDPIKSSLPNKETLLSLIDTHILMIPSSSSSGADGGSHFNVYEELELLEMLRIQVEERQTKEIQMAIFDTLFGLTASDDKMSCQYRLSLLQKLLSLSISGIGNGTIMHCATYWMEMYPTDATGLIQSLYFEFCELLPNAMDSLLQLGHSFPSLAKLFVHHLTLYYPIHHSGRHGLCPPIRCLQLVSHWLSSNSEFLKLPPLVIESSIPYIRSNPPISPSHASPLVGLFQWTVLEPLLSSDAIISTNNQLKVSESDFTSQYRIEMSKFHANLMSYLMSIANVHVSLSIDDISCVIANISSLHDDGGSNDTIQLSLDRLGQLLQVGLTVGVINISQGSLANVLQHLPKNRLLHIVCSHCNK